MAKDSSNRMNCFIQARMSSKRLPGKVLYSTNKGEKVLLSIYRRLEQSLFLDKIIILTSSENSDDPIQDLCQQEGLKCMRGPLENVYSRFSMALAEYPCSAFLRICADSPFVNIPMIDHAISNFFEKKECYYLSNTIKRTFPKGLSVQICNTQQFLSPSYSSQEEFSYEHICSSFESQEFSMKRISLSTKQIFDRSSYALDEKEDLDLLEINSEIEIDQSMFTYERI